MSDGRRDLTVCTLETGTFVDPVHKVGDAVLYSGAGPALCLVGEE